ncbi:MAG: tryptophan-rich sensory protein [Candidatus Peribacteraceae bacterium]|nr:tryptophan-rich sensory protein [Candidatus Peribacteraceae bacterium]
MFGSIAIVALTILTAVIGGLVTSKGLGWYSHIKKPSWTPPGSTIGKVWTVIYTLAALSAIIAYNTVAGDILAWVMLWFFINAILNAAWSGLFFGFKLKGAAVIDSILLECSILILMWLLWHAAPIAAALLIPYAAWVCFATYLTYTVREMNRR